MGDQQTLEEFVTQYHTRDPLHVANSGRDRLWIHDMLHALLGFSITSAKGEEQTSIFQAVALKECTVSFRTKRTASHDSKRDISFEEIHTQVIPQIRGYFLKTLGEKEGFTSRPALTGKQQKELYLKATIFNRLIHEKFGCTLAEIKIDDLKRCPAIDMIAIVTKMEQQYKTVSRPFIAIHNNCGWSRS